MKLTVEIESWPFRSPFSITGYTFTAADVVVVTLQRKGATGRGEACGVYYRHETPQSMHTQIESVRADIEGGIDREALRGLLPPGGARNAVDCALWDLEASASGTPVWQAAGIGRLRPVLTTITIGAGGPAEMARMAASHADVSALKLKLTGAGPAECVRAVRAARPDVWLGVDANQGFTRASLEALVPVFEEARVSLIEQPLPVSRDADLLGFSCPIPVAGDESIQSLDDLSRAIGRYDAINIKLDKCGGLTEALLLEREARKLGLKAMVGCMSSTSLAIAPAFVLAQLCDFVDLDGPALLARDRAHPATYERGELYCPGAIWGGGASGDPAAGIRPTLPRSSSPR